MNIALLGCGKTGREIESAALARGHSIVGRFTSHHPLTEARMAALRAQCAVDCCVDFSTASAVFSHIRLCVTERIPIVVGTTGWHDDLPEIRALVVHGGGALVHAANFSVGAHLYLTIIKEAARLMNAHAEYDPSVHEIHHRLKKDAPSGTAGTISAILIGALERKRAVRTQMDLSSRPLAPEDLCVSSERVGSVFGTHTVTFSSESDEIELTHRAHTRRGFAVGALMAAEWVQGRRGIFTADDVFFS